MNKLRDTFRFPELEVLSQLSNESGGVVESVFERMTTIISTSHSLRDIRIKSKNFQYVVQISSYSRREAANDSNETPIAIKGQAAEIIVFPYAEAVVNNEKNYLNLESNDYDKTPQSDEEVLMNYLLQKFVDDFEDIYLSEDKYIEMSEDLYNDIFKKIYHVFSDAYSMGMRDSEEMRKYLIEYISMEEENAKERKIQENRASIHLVE